MRQTCTLLALIMLACTAATSSAAIITQYDSGAGVSLSPTTQGWSTHDIIEEGSPTPPLATAINTSGDGSLANAGAGTTGWIIRDYLDGQSGGVDDRPEYVYDLTSADFTAMATYGWKFTSTFKIGNVTVGRDMRVLSIDQGGGHYLPFDIKVNARDDASGNLFLEIAMEDGSGDGTITSFDAGVDASQFNTVIMEDVDGDGTFAISINGTPLMNTTDSSFIFDATAKSNGIADENVLVIGAESSGTEGGGIEYDLVRLETVPEPASWILFFTAGLALLWSRRRV